MFVCVIKKKGGYDDYIVKEKKFFLIWKSDFVKNVNYRIFKYKIKYNYF